MKATMAMAWKMEGIAFEIRLRTAGRGILAANHRRGAQHSQPITGGAITIIAGQSPERWNDR
jgi:hypothetical protein